MPNSPQIEARHGVPTPPTMASLSPAISICRPGPDRSRAGRRARRRVAGRRAQCLPVLGALPRRARLCPVRDQLSAGQKGQKMFPQAVQDMLAAVQFVRGSAAELKVDPERIGLFGASAGGHLASLAALGGASFQGAYPNDAHAKVSTKVKALIGVYGVYDLVEMWQRYQLQSPRENNIETPWVPRPWTTPKLYFEASSINYATFANSHIGVLLSVGTEDDLVCRQAHTDAFLLRLKQANFSVRTCIVQGAPHFWLSDPIDEPGSCFRLHGAAPHPLPQGAAVTPREMQFVTVHANRVYSTSVFERRSRHARCRCLQRTMSCNSPPRCVGTPDKSRPVSRTRCSVQRVSAERCTADPGPTDIRYRVCSASLRAALAPGDTSLTTCTAPCRRRHRSRSGWRTRRRTCR